MKRVLVHGYFRANLGDDLFFRVLAIRYPHVQFVIPTLRCDYKAIFRDLSNVKIVDFLKVARLTKRKVYTLPKIYSELFMKHFDAVVCIGGSLFIDRREPSPQHQAEIENFSFLCDWEYAQAANVPYYVLGVNWGPCYNKYFYNYFDHVFDSLQDLYFRDKASFHEFSCKRVARCGSDILLGHPMLRAAVEGVSTCRQIAISVISKFDGLCNKDLYYEKIAAFCDHYVQQNYTVKLLSFCKDEGDEEACNQVLRRVAHPENVQPVFYRGNWQQMLQEIARSQLMIASRFHATVLAWTLGIPAFSIAYSNKSKNLTDDCGVSDSCICLEQIDSLSADTLQMKAALPEISAMRCGVEQAFLRLDQLLK